MLAKRKISVTQSQVMVFLLKFDTSLTQINCDLIGSPVRINLGTGLSISAHHCISNNVIRPFSSQKTLQVFP